MSNHRIAAELKRIFESAPPDLRRFLRPNVPGMVIAVDDDAHTVDIEVKPDEDAEDPTPWLLPKTPVSCLAGGDGFGVWALPEIGSEVNVSFRGQDITQPRVDGVDFLANRTPLGSRVGSFVFADNSGQRIVLRPDTGEVVIRAYNLDDEVAGTRSERTAGNANGEVQGNDFKRVGGNRERTIAGDDTVTLEDGARHFVSKNFEEHGDYSEEMGAVTRDYQHAKIVHGAARRKVSGREDYDVAGDRKKKVLGDEDEAVAKNKSVVIGGRLRIMATGLAPDGSLPSGDDLVCVEIGGPGLNVFGGKFIPGTSQPMVNGLSLAVYLATYLEALSAAVGVYNLAVAGLPNPITPSSLSGITATLTSSIETATTNLIVALFGSPAVPGLPALPILSPRVYFGGPF
ncbi:phage baseplate assembly protein V [bacterium]|nr:phage baseplate assembly protein V [bacterium]